MKNYLIFIALLGLLFIVGCNMNKKNSSDVIATGTDSSMMTRTNDSSLTSSAVLSGDTSVVAKEKGGVSSVTDSVLNKKSVNKDAHKKLKKGKISVLENSVSTGNMSADKEGFYSNTEVLPAFPGGQKALENFFEKNISYPDNAAENNIEGIVLLNFLVDENGKVYAPKVISKNVGYGVETEAIRVFNKMPVWTPGKIKGKNVKTKYTLPIKFQLD